jgi:hypothetical protein
MVLFRRIDQESPRSICPGLIIEVDVAVVIAECPNQVTMLIIDKSLVSDVTPYCTSLYTIVKIP